MSKNKPDEKFDALMKDLLTLSAIDDEQVTEIADSPAIWWGVQKRIAESKDSAGSGWLPVGNVWRLLLAGVPAMAVVLILISIYGFRPLIDGTDTAGGQQNASVEPVDTPAHEVERALPASIPVDQPVIAGLKTPGVTDRKPHAVGPPAARTLPIKALRFASSAKSEIKTEFIALSYARDPESGQIVRVKVPSSMMVTLGLVSSVEKPSDLVDAEVIVGDDGLTRAIRFIR